MRYTVLSSDLGLPRANMESITVLLKCDEGRRTQYALQNRLG
jgi:hypothetical protein